MAASNNQPELSKDQAEFTPRTRQMTGAELAVLFEELYTLTSDPSKAEVSPQDVLEKHGVRVDLPPSLSRQVMPLLTRPGGAGPVGPGGPGTLGNACGACGACGVCAACGEINLGAPGAAAAAIWAIL
jgi:hypothetical protein